MQHRDVLNASAFVLAALAAAQPTAAAAMTAKDAVDQAKARGIVGEQADGLLGFVQASSDPALREAVREINEGRLELYRQAAARNGVSVEAAGAAAFNTVVQSRLKPGEFYKPAGGGWVRK